jgi:hypothetical protein
MSVLLTRVGAGVGSAVGAWQQVNTSVSTDNMLCILAGDVIYDGSLF